MGRARTWLNVALLALVVLLAALAYFRPGAGPETPERPALTERRPAGVDRLRVEPRQGPAAVLQRDGERWRLREPRAMPAEADAVRRALGLLEAESRAEVQRGDQGLAPYGLAEPDAVLEMGGHRFVIGGRHPMKGQRYVLVDDTLHLVEARRVRRLGEAWTDYASRRLLPAQASAARIELPGATLMRGDGGEWRARASAEGQEIAPAAARRTAEAWRHRRARGLEAAEPEGAEEAPVVQIHLEGREEPLRFRVLEGGEQPRLYRPALGLVYRLGAGGLEALVEPASGPSARAKGGAS